MNVFCYHCFYFFPEGHEFGGMAPPLYLPLNMLIQCSLHVDTNDKVLTRIDRTFILHNVPIKTEFSCRYTTFTVLPRQIS